MRFLPAKTALVAAQLYLGAGVSESESVVEDWSVLQQTWTTRANLLERNFLSTGR